MSLFDVLGSIIRRCYSTVKQGGAHKQTSMSPQMTQSYHRINYPARKRLMLDSCKEALSHRFMIVLQNNSIPSKALTELRYLLKMAQFELRFIRPSIFNVHLRQPETPSSLYILSKIMTGPIVLAYSNVEPASAVNGFKVLLNEPRLIMLGGKFEHEVFTNEGLKDLIFKLASRESLHLELLQTIQPIPLIQLLEYPSSHLSFILNQRQTQLKQESLGET